MSPEKQPSGSIEIDTADRIVLANAALDVVNMFDRTAEVLIGFQRLLRESELDGLSTVDAFDIPYETFKHIGRKLQARLVDNSDQRSVKVRDDYTYRIVYDPERQHQQATSRRPARNLGYIGSALAQRGSTY